MLPENSEYLKDAAAWHLPVAAAFGNYYRIPYLRGIISSESFAMIPHDSPSFV
jgi:hypothetical protein